MGLPGSGKTTLAKEIVKYLIQSNLTVEWLNSDEIRKRVNDWDFSHEGRIRQSLRMYELSELSRNDVCVADFVAPLPIMRQNFKPNMVIWLDTINEGRYDDTNSIFTKPDFFHFRIIEKNASKYAPIISEYFKTHIYSNP